MMSMITETQAMGDNVRSDFSNDMRTDLVNNGYNVNKSNELNPTRPISYDVHGGNFDSDEDAQIPFINRNKRRICDSEDEDLEESCDVNKSHKHIDDKIQGNIKKMSTKPKLCTRIFSSSDESDTDVTDTNRLSINSKDNLSCTKEIVNNGTQLDSFQHSTASNESDNGPTYVPDHIEKLNGNNGKRVNTKRNKMIQKLRSLTSPKSETTEITNLNISDTHVKNVPDLSNICDNSDSSEDTNINSPITKMKHSKKQSFKKLVTDNSESSDEEHTQAEIERKREKPHNDDYKNSSKQLKISAKQAMENRQVINSESNRMLRDKQVTLPYHRPKPLSFKEIMNRRRPTLMPNGTELPLKMNEEQLKHYALQLQQQQKEFIELCKSDSEDEQPPVIPQEQEQIIKNYKDVLDKSSDNIDSNNDEKFSAFETEIENNPLEFQNTTSEDVDLPSAEFGRTEPFTFTTDSNKNFENKASLYVIHTELFESDNAMKCINPKLVNTVKESQISTATGDEKFDYRNAVNIIDSEDNTSIDRDRVMTCMNYRKPNHTTEVINSVAQDSQLIHLQYDSEEWKIAKQDSHTETIEECVEINNSVLNCAEDRLVEMVKTKTSTNDTIEKCNINNNADNVTDVNILFESMSEEIENFDMINIDSIVDMTNEKNCDKSVQNISASVVVQDHVSLNMGPKLRGAPGMVINLDGDEPIISTKMSGMELLKQRFQYFAKIKTPEDLEREKEKKIKPGTLHSKLKQELEDKIAEQRCLEWSRRLEEEKLENNSVAEGKVNDDDDVLESIEAKLNKDADFEEKTASIQESESEEESEPEDIVYKDDNRKKNPLIDDEAEESDVDDLYETDDSKDDSDIEKASENVDIYSDSDESSESSNEDKINENRKKRNRILKAFEDSDDDGECNKNAKCEDAIIIESVLTNSETKPIEKTICALDHNLKGVEESQVPQLHKTQSEDLFASQNTDIENSLTESTSSVFNNNQIVPYRLYDNENISHSSLKFDKLVPLSHDQCPEKLPIICTTQIDNEVNLDDVALMCSGTFSQNLVTSQSCTQLTQSSDTQKISEHDSSLNEDQKGDNEMGPLSPPKVLEPVKVTDFNEASVKKSSVEENLLHTILNEMDEADLDNPKPNKYFCGDSSSKGKENKKNFMNIESKKKFIIESDEEETQLVEVKTKHKRRNREKRVLQISDDEEEQSENGSDISEDFEIDGSPKNIVEYDSEENEVEVLKPQKLKRKARDFLEQEAELTSEDEWAGSGDEDEVGLDRMEREEGDDETFNQRKLRNELGQIHMRDVLDQDKREVRLLQELLLEDGDLGEGHRQRKFRWKNADGEEMTGTVPDDLNDTQEEEFESEELWRKQRHERETFLRQMKEQDTEIFNSNITRNTIIKANLNSKSISNLSMEVNTSKANEEEPITKEKKSAVLSPVKEQSPMFQQQPRSSFLSRGKGTLERLAALATSLAVDAEQEPTNMSALASTSKRNFVFSILTPPTKEENKVTKRKAACNVGTTNLMKKMKVNEEPQKPLKKSLLEQINF